MSPERPDRDQDQCQRRKDLKNLGLDQGLSLERNNSESKQDQRVELTNLEVGLDLDLCHMTEGPGVNQIQGLRRGGFPDLGVNQDIRAPDLQAGTETGRGDPHQILQGDLDLNQESIHLKTWINK